jgi:hypothetical protein
MLERTVVEKNGCLYLKWAVHVQNGRLVVKRRVVVEWKVVVKRRVVVNRRVVG